MQRRAVLQSVGGLLAAALGGDAVAGTPSAAAWLAEHDSQRLRLSGLRLPAPVRDELRRQGLRDGLLGEAFGALGTVAAFRDLPARVQRDPGARARLAREGEVLGRAVLEVTAWLERLSAAERVRRGRVLRDDPALAELISEGILAESRAQGAEPARLRQLTRALDRATWRLSRQDPGLVIDECIDTVDRAARRVGLERVPGGPVAPDWTPVGRPEAQALASQESRLTGEIIKHAGQLVCLFGLMVGGISLGVGFVMSAGLFVLYGITAAALVLVVGLILIIVGAFVNNP